MLTCALCSADCTGHAVEFVVVANAPVGDDETPIPVEVISLCPACAEPWRGYRSLHHSIGDDEGLQLDLRAAVDAAKAKRYAPPMVAERVAAALDVDAVLADTRIDIYARNTVVLAGFPVDDDGACCCEEG